jgi:hypothetical protein
MSRAVAVTVGGQAVVIPPAGPPAGYSVYPTSPANFAAGCNAAAKTYLPAATYTFSDFVSGTYFGANLNTCTSLKGAGIDQTYIQMNPSTSTRADEVGNLPNGGGNFYSLMNMGFGSGRGGGPKLTVEDFTMTGNSQGHVYNGLRLTYSNAPIVRNIKITGIPGNDSTPPGETFVLESYNCLNALFENCILDGRLNGTGSGPGVSASLLGLNNTDHGTFNDIVMKYANPAFALAAWQSTDGDFTRCVFDNNDRVPVHIENCDGVWNFYNCTWTNTVEFHAVIANSVDYLTGQTVLNFYDPTYDAFKGDGKFWVRIVLWAGLNQSTTIGTGSTPGAINLYVGGVLRGDLVRVQIG